MSGHHHNDDHDIEQSLHDIEVQEELIRANVHFLTKQVDNANFRLIKIEHQLEAILAILGATSGSTTGSRLTQTSGGFMSGTLSIIAGQTGTFLRSNLPPGSLGLATGTVPAFSVDDPAVSLGPDPTDPNNPDKVSAAVAATDTGASFNLTVLITPANADGSAGAQVSNVFNVAIQPAVTPPVLTTGSDLTQSS